MSNPAHSAISPEMRDRLLTNRHGKLTSDQWKDMITEPLVILLILVVPIIVFMGPRAAALTARGIGFVLLVGLILLGVPMLLRAQRYARAPVYFARLYAGDSVGPVAFVRRSQTLYTEDGKKVRFQKRLAPALRLRPNHAYLVYYLRDREQNVLLSLAPADHPDAERWQPSTAFHERFARRGGRASG